MLVKVIDDQSIKCREDNPADQLLIEIIVHESLNVVSASYINISKARFG